MTITELQFIRLFEQHIIEHHDNKAAAARHWGKSPQFVYKILQGYSGSNPTQQMLDDLGGFERQVTKAVHYVRK